MLEVSIFFFFLKLHKMAKAGALEAIWMLAFQMDWRGKRLQVKRLS